MTVLAEGVETAEQAQWLTELGCDYLQGFYFSKPVTKEEYLAIMKENYLKANGGKLPENNDDIEELEEL